MTPEERYELVDHIANYAETWSKASIDAAIELVERLETAAEARGWARAMTQEHPPETG